MQALTFIIPYSIQAVLVNMNLEPGAGEYKLRAEASKYKLGSGLSNTNWGWG